MVGSDESLDLRQSLCGSGQESEEAEWDQIQLDQILRKRGLGVFVKDPNRVCSTPNCPECPWHIESRDAQRQCHSSISGGGSEEEERTGLVERLEQLAKEFNHKRFQQVYQRRRYKKKNDEGKAVGNKEVEIQKGFDGGSSSSSKGQSCGRSGKGIEKEMGPSRVMVERELEKLKKGKMPVLDHKKEMELTNLGKFFGASTKENQKQLQGLIERTLKEGLMAMEEEKLEHMEKIQALETDSEDWEEDEEEEENGREEGLGGIEEATYRAEASGKARDLKGKQGKSQIEKLSCLL